MKMRIRSNFAKGGGQIRTLAVMSIRTLVLPDCTPSLSELLRNFEEFRIPNHSYFKKKSDFSLCNKI